jgi:hypothetical protein
MFRSGVSKVAGFLALVGAFAAAVGNADPQWVGFLRAQYSNQFMPILVNIGIAIAAWAIWYVVFRAIFWVFGVKFKRLDS